MNARIEFKYAADEIEPQHNYEVLRWTCGICGEPEEENFYDRGRDEESTAQYRADVIRVKNHYDECDACAEVERTQPLIFEMFKRLATNRLQPQPERLRIVDSVRVVRAPQRVAKVGEAVRIEEVDVEFHERVLEELDEAGEVLHRYLLTAAPGENERLATKESDARFSAAAKDFLEESRTGFSKNKGKK